MFSDDDVAALYDQLNPWDPARRGDAGFYTRLVMAAGSVLDVGCGTGLMLYSAREQGHAGRLAGLDPDRFSLARARRRDDIEWAEATAADAPWLAEFELATAVSCRVTEILGCYHADNHPRRGNSPPCGRGISAIMNRCRLHVICESEAYRWTDDGVGLRAGGAVSGGGRRCGGRSGGRGRGSPAR